MVKRNGSLRSSASPDFSTFTGCGRRATSESAPFSLPTATYTVKPPSRVVPPCGSSVIVEGIVTSTGTLKFFPSGVGFPLRTWIGHSAVGVGLNTFATTRSLNCSSNVFGA